MSRSRSRLAAFSLSPKGRWYWLTDYGSEQFDVLIKRIRSPLVRKNEDNIIPNMW